MTSDRRFIGERHIQECSCGGVVVFDEDGRSNPEIVVPHTLPCSLEAIRRAFPDAEVSVLDDGRTDG